MILFHYRLKWLADWGLVDYWIKMIKPQNEKCNLNNLKAFSKARDDRKILSLNDLSGPFIFLIMGSMLSLFVFLLEKLYYHFNQVVDLKSTIIGTGVKAEEGELGTETIEQDEKPEGTAVDT